jgi:hypothetical protein
MSEALYVGRARLCYRVNPFQGSVRFSDDHYMVTERGLVGAYISLGLLPVVVLCWLALYPGLKLVTGSSTLPNHGGIGHVFVAVAVLLLLPVVHALFRVRSMRIDPRESTVLYRERSACRHRDIVFKLSDLTIQKHRVRIWAFRQRPLTGWVTILWANDRHLCLAFSSNEQAIDDAINVLPPELQRRYRGSGANISVYSMIGGWTGGAVSRS